jgi:hypothetical protein
VRCGGKSDGEAEKGGAHREAGNGSGGGSGRLRGPTVRGGGCEGRHVSSLREEKWHGREKGVMAMTHAFYSRLGNVER